ncbi:MAG: hypothetical protein Q4D55_00215 [Eubacteriales bacterium]|nr:hypothetical protein [Eubacteriales bacterium]
METADRQRKEISGKWKKRMLVLGTILVLALVFSWISWSAMDPKETMSLDLFRRNAERGLVEEVDRINGRCLAAVADEEDGKITWYGLEPEAGKDMGAFVEQVAEVTEIPCNQEEVSFVTVFLMYVLQLGVCYGVAAGLWSLYGRTRIKRRKEHYRKNE